MLIRTVLIAVGATMVYIILASLQQVSIAVLLLGTIVSAVVTTPLLNTLTGERRWDKGLLVGVVLALATLGAGTALRGARAADPPPVVHTVLLNRVCLCTR